MMRRYTVCGRKLPSETEPNPEICRLQIFAPNSVVAESRFWHYMRTLKRVKASHGQLISCVEEVEEDKHQVRNFGFWIRYRSTKGQHNMYKEFRDTTICAAADHLYREMAGHYRARYHCVEIIKVVELKDEECKRPAVTMFHSQEVHFPPSFPMAHFKNVHGDPFKYRRPRVAL